MCKHKIYSVLESECHLISDYAFSTKISHLHELPYYRIEIRDAMKPTMWDVNDQGRFLIKKTILDIINNDPCKY